MSKNVLDNGHSNAVANKAAASVKDYVDSTVEGLSGSYDPLGAADTAQSNAETFAANASNLTTGTIPNTRISALPNANLAHSSITIAGHTVALGGTQALANTDIGGTTAGAIPFVSTSNKLTEDTSALFWDATNKRFGIGTSTPAQMLDIESTFGSYLNNMAAITLTFTRNTADANAGSVILRKSRGSSTVPTIVITNDVLGTFSFRGHTGSGTTYNNCAQLACQVIDPTPSTTAMGGRLFLSVSPIGSVTQTEMIRLEPATGLSMFGANPVIDQNRCHVLRGFTVSTLPTPSGTSTKMPTTFVNDATLGISAGLGLAPIGSGTNRVPVFDDGAWKIG